MQFLAKTLALVSTFAVTRGDLANECKVNKIDGCTFGALLEIWEGKGGDVKSLLEDPRYPSSPDKREILFEQFKAPANNSDNFLGRAQAYVIPPVTGHYTFYISSVNGGVLNLSRNSSPLDKVTIASVDGGADQWTDPVEWDKYDSQKSASQYLEENQLYYLEALQTESGGGDKLAIAWERKDEAGNVTSPRDVIKADQMVAVACECAHQIPVKYVRVSLKGDNKIISLAEVQVFATVSGATVGGVETDIALGSLGATAEQSSTRNDAPASRAIDGNTNGLVMGEITHTQPETDPWWRVDLGVSTQQDTIKRVVLWNRREQDCCSSRLSYARVSILDSSGNSISERSIGDSTNIEKFELDLSSGPRHVRVFIKGDNKIISLAEVQVFALVDGEETDIALQSLGATAFQSSTRNDAPASRAIDGNTNGLVMGEITHTQPETDPWWRVDLGASAEQYEITSIVLWNRQEEDCCSSRLSYAKVSILDSANNIMREMSIGDSTNIRKFKLYPNSPRKVKVSLEGDHKIISLAEVQVFVFVNGTETDIALQSLGATADQSSIRNEAPASRAIDGNTNGLVMGEITHTQPEKDPWWIVDLGADAQQYQITRVVLWNRREEDCCSSRLSGARVTLLDSDELVIAEKSIGDSTGVVKFDLPFI